MKNWIGAVLVVLSPLFFAGGAKAKVYYEYAYTGLDFTTAVGSYSTSDSVTGDFTVLTQLSNGLHVITPLSYSFSDGVQTLTNLNSKAVISVVVSSGKISTWTVDLYTGATAATSGAEVISTTYTSFLKVDFGTEDYTNPLSVNFGERTTSTDLKGSWNVSAVPEPSTWALMLLGFAGIAFAGYRRSRPPAASAVAD